MVVAALGLLVRGLVAPRARHTDELTPWQRQTWTAPMLERLRPPRKGRGRLLTLGVLRIYIVLIAGVLLLKLSGLLPA